MANKTNNADENKNTFAALEAILTTAFASDYIRTGEMIGKVIQNVPNSNGEKVAKKVEKQIISKLF